MKIRQEAGSGSEPKRPLSSDARVLLRVGIAVGVLVAVAFAFTFIDGPGPDPDSPEGVVQHYLQAVVDGRRREALSYTSDRLQRECDSGFPRYVSRDAYRIEWIETVMEGSRAEVEVWVAEQDPEFFGSGYEFHAFFALESTGDGWKIIEQEWPWYGCSEPMLDDLEAAG